MATHTAVSAQHATLTANSMDTVTLSASAGRIVIKNRATAPGSCIYATINGADPVVGADDTIAVAAGETFTSAGNAVFPAAIDCVVKLISSTADAYTVSTEGEYAGGGLATGGSAAGSNSDTAGTGTKSNVASSASSVTILAANASRKRWSVYNDSTAVLYLDTTGGTASASSYTVQVAAGGYFEGPTPVNTGAITGIWASVNGSARVVEFA